MRLSLIGIGVALALAPAVASAQTTAGAGAPAHVHSTGSTPLGDILDDPAAKAILDKYAPHISKGDQVDLARGMTLVSLQQFAPDILTDKVLAEMDADFAKVPAKQ